MQAFPHIIHAERQALPDFIKSHKRGITHQVESIGAVLFRGFDIDTAEKLDEVVAAYGEPGFTYEKSLSNAVRVNLTPRVFTANEAPPDVSIYLHHEMAQTPLYPSKLFFGCLLAPETGGATPICRSDWVLDRLKKEQPGLVKAFREKGVTYTNIMPAEPDPESGQGRSWKDTLSAKTKKAAEARLEELGYSWSWEKDGSLKATTPRLDAIRETSPHLEVGRMHAMIRLNLFVTVTGQLSMCRRSTRPSKSPTSSLTISTGKPVMWFWSIISASCMAAAHIKASAAWSHLWWRNTSFLTEIGLRL